MAEPKSTQIQTDPEVRDRIGEAIMTSMICTHEFQEMVCGVCWESTQRIGEALIRSLPQLQLGQFEPVARWQQVSETYRVTAGDRIRAEYTNDEHGVELTTVTAPRDGVAIRHLFASAYPVGRYSILLGVA